MNQTVNVNENKDNDHWMYLIITPQMITWSYCKKILLSQECNILDDFMNLFLISLAVIFLNNKLKEQFKPMLR